MQGQARISSQLLARAARLSPLLRFPTWFVITSFYLVDASALKKKLAPPKKNPQFAAETLPAPRPLLKPPPPLVGFSIKNGSPPPPGDSDSPFPLPEHKKIKNIRNVHQLLADWRDEARLMPSTCERFRDKNPAAMQSIKYC